MSNNLLMLGRNKRRKKEERVRKEMRKEEMSEGVRTPVFLSKNQAFP